MCLAIPGRLISTAFENGLKMGQVNYNGTVGKACLDFVPDALVGQYLIVHAGFALSVLDENEAQRSLELIDEMQKSNDAVEVETE